MCSFAPAKLRPMGQLWQHLEDEGLVSTVVFSHVKAHCTATQQAGLSTNSLARTIGNTVADDRAKLGAEIYSPPGWQITNYNHKWRDVQGFLVYIEEVVGRLGTAQDTEPPRTRHRVRLRIHRRLFTYGDVSLCWDCDRLCCTVCSKSGKVPKPIRAFKRSAC